MRCCPALAALLAASLTTGCVERRYVITSDPPGSLVYRDGRPIGTTPVDDSYVYYGKYHFTLVKDGYETLQVEENFATPWYEYPPLDFFAENVWPLKIQDVRRPSYQLQPLRQVQHEDVLNSANALRARGKTLVPFNPASVPVQPQAAPPAQAAVPPAVAPVPPATPPPTTDPPRPIATAPINP